VVNPAFPGGSEARHSCEVVLVDGHRALNVRFGSVRSNVPHVDVQEAGEARERQIGDTTHRCALRRHFRNTLDTPGHLSTNIQRR
jgi:hypothetical protein